MGAQESAQRIAGGFLQGLAAAWLRIESPALNFLLDTNVVSEWTKPRPNAGLVDWLAQVDESEVFLSVVTFAELRHGIERLAAGAVVSMSGCAMIYQCVSRSGS
jgi:hypothetical protein